MNARLMMALMAVALLSGSAIAYAAASGTASGLVDIDIQNVPVRQAIGAIFEGRGMAYIIEPGVTGNVVELKLKGITVAEALKALGDAAGFTCRIEEGIYMIGPKTAPAVPRVAARVDSVPAKTQTPSAPPPARRAPAPVQAPPVTVNNFIPVGGSEQQAYAYAPPYYGGFYSPFFTIGPPPYVMGRWANPPPPPGWFSPDVDRFLRFEWAVPRRPSFITPY